MAGGVRTAPRCGARSGEGSLVIVAVSEREPSGSSERTCRSRAAARWPASAGGGSRGGVAPRPEPVVWLAGGTGFRALASLARPGSGRLQPRASRELSNGTSASLVAPCPVGVSVLDPAGKSFPLDENVSAVPCLGGSRCFHRGRTLNERLQLSRSGTSGFNRPLTGPRFRTSWATSPCPDARPDP